MRDACHTSHSDKIHLYITIHLEVCVGNVVVDLHK